MKINDYKFKSAVPVWEYGKEKEMNLFIAFRCECGRTDSAKLCLTGSTSYTVSVNGNFVAYGPARCAHGFYRVDELDISGYTKKEENIIVITVAGYNCYSYYLLNQPSFLCAELITDGTVAAATGKSGFIAREVAEHEQLVERYSYQRTFCEVYNYDKSYNAFFKNDKISTPAIKIVPTEQKRFIARGCAYTEYPEINAEALCVTGTFEINDHSDELRYPRHVAGVSDIFSGYTVDKVTTDSLLEARNIDILSADRVQKAPGASLSNGEYGIFRFPNNTTGQLCFNVTCKDDVKLIITFDEILSENDFINFRRMSCVNSLVWRLSKGSYSVSTFEPYTMKYASVHVIGGEAEISDIRIRFFGADDTDKKVVSDDADIKRIYDAALQTYRQNTFTVFMDCPSRERACWLCDSFFTSRTERVLTGKSEIEHNFIENFLLPEKYPFVPEGMLPMVYPGDHPNGNFIPNWAMFFVLELKEYFIRTGDADTVSAAKEKIYGLMDYFKAFENEYGLLEKLPGWVFVEWSKSNELIQDVNFPTNMLYAAMLKAVCELYGDDSLYTKALGIEKTVNELSFDGKFYNDNMVRENGVLVSPQIKTESCQYYAFFCGTATRETRGELWETLLNDFGPDRAVTGKHPEVFPANTFIGDYLRLELLYLYGEHDKLLNDIKGYFTNMALTTGTLWENDTPHASCNHGFASHVIYWLDKLGMIK